jgi:DNA-directed RNA polymerase subunit RPC12/RpoP
MEGQGAVAGALGPQWEGGAQALFLGLREWRARHPAATLQEIEAELDGRWATLRGQVLADLALASDAADVAAGPACPHCGGRLRGEGPRERTLVTTGGAPVTLRRDYASCTRCGYRLFPPGR